MSPAESGPAAAPTAEIAIVGFSAHGHFPLHLRALLLAARPFWFIGARELWRRGTTGLPACHEGDALLRDACAEDTPEGELDWLDQALAKHPGIRRVVLFHLNRYPRQLLRHAWRRRWPALARCQVEGFLVPPQEFCDRRSRQDSKEFVKWNAWILAVTLAPRPLRMLMISATGRPFLPGWARALTRGRVRTCPEPYDRLSIADELRCARDAAPASVLFFGFHTPRKGTAWALQALRGTNIALRCIVAGDCQEREQIVALAAALPASVEAELHLQRIDDETKQRLYKRATVVALPYLGYYGSSGVLFEAMIYRCRVVISSICAVSADLVQCGAVHVYDAGDEAGFRRALEAALRATVNWGVVDAFLARHGVQAFAAAVLDEK